MQRSKARWAARVPAIVLAAALAGGICLILPGSRAFADPPTAMAPPVTAAGPSSGDSDSVFQWNEVPANQEVPLTRAVFDQQGYQLYDTVGETIVVPFNDDNLYVMKFAVSPNGDTYFMNTGDYPVMYLPRDGYLENADVPGARWYPFSDSFHPSHPVFVGIAPSWSAFIAMGWYPHMVFYGGYWSHTAFVSGAVFLPTIGLNIVIGGHPYNSWDDYHAYVVGHHAPFLFGHPGGFPAGHTFRGAGGEGGRPFSGPVSHGHSFGDHVFRGARSGHDHRNHDRDH